METFLQYEESDLTMAEPVRHFNLTEHYHTTRLIRVRNRGTNDMWLEFTGNNPDTPGPPPSDFPPGSWCNMIRIPAGETYETTMTGLRWARFTRMSMDTSYSIYTENEK